MSLRSPSVSDRAGPLSPAILRVAPVNSYCAAALSTEIVTPGPIVELSAILVI